MRNVKRMFSGRLKGINDVGSVEQGIEKVSGHFPGQDLQRRIGRNLMKMADHEWELPDEREKAREEIEGMRIETREILSFGTLYDYSPVSYPAYEETVVMARCKDLALRHRPEPGALGEGSRALLEVLKLDRQRLDLDPWAHIK